MWKWRTEDAKVQGQKNGASFMKLNLQKNILTKYYEIKEIKMLDKLQFDNSFFKMHNFL